MLTLGGRVDTVGLAGVGPGGSAESLLEGLLLLAAAGVDHLGKRVGWCAGTTMCESKGFYSVRFLIIRLIKICHNFQSSFH